MEIKEEHMGVSEVVLSIGQDIIINVVKNVYRDKTLIQRLEKELKKAITKAVKAELPYEHDKGIIEGISNDIFYACKEEKIYNLKLEDIIEKTLLEHADYNKNPKVVARGIAATLPMQIIYSRELNSLINSQLTFETLARNKEILDKLGIIEKSIYNLRFNNQDIRQLLIELMKLSKGMIDNEKKMDLNNKFIPEKYREYFFNKLFLEENIEDGPNVRLKDVYIEPHFCVMDFENNNGKIIGDNIIKFIEEFIGVERKNRKYKSIFNFRDKCITTLFIKGHPGSGKSSLFYYLAYMKSHEAEFLPGYKMFFIKLIELYKESNNTLSETNPLADIERHLNLDESKFHNTVLVLDGLDEICAAKDINIYEYCSNLIESTFKYKNFKIIITTRINYINITYRENKNVINIGLQNWTIDDLERWTSKYFLIHKKSSDLLKIAKENIRYLSDNQNEEMLTILAVPLLFYMITAIGLDLNKLESIGQLYDKVFEELYVRNYSENANNALQKCGIIKIIPKEVSKRIAMEIAYKMYQKNELLLGVNSHELEDAIVKVVGCEGKIGMDMLYKSQIEKLYPITFFYKEVNDVVEFAHKSIMEFFCAEKLFNEFKNKNESIDQFILHNMIENAISIEIMQFFIYFFHKEKIDTGKYKEEIIESFEHIINGGEQLTRINQKAYGFEVSKLICKIYWIFIKEIVKSDITDINRILSNDYMNSYLKGVLSIPDSKNIPFINNTNYEWNFNGCKFPQYNFDNTDVHHAKFENVEFIDCSFVGANLSNCRLVGVKVRGLLDFSYSNLTKAVLQNITSKNGKIKFNYVRIKDTVIRQVDVRNWIFCNNIYEGNLLFDQVKLNANQVENFSKLNVEYQQVEIYLDTSLITGRDLSYLKKIHKERKKNWNDSLEKYIDNIVIEWCEKNVNDLEENINYNVVYDRWKFEVYINEYIYNSKK